MFWDNVFMYIWLYKINKESWVVHYNISYLYYPVIYFYKLFSAKRLADLIEFSNTDSHSSLFTLFAFILHTNLLSSPFGVEIELLHIFATVFFIQSSALNSELIKF